MGVEWTNVLHNKKHNNYGAIKYRKARLARHIAPIEEIRNLNNIIFREPQVRKLFERRETVERTTHPLMLFL
jgi:hypothetical protein